MYHSDDTIAAIASASGGAARGVIRISGPRTAEVLASVFVPEQPADLCVAGPPRRAAGTLRASIALRGPLSIPVELYFWPGPRSYTREQMAELHTFGSAPLLAAGLRSLCDAGARLAAPGEFTLRAFIAGRIDLTEAEAVLGVIDAENPNELQTALEQLAGGLARPLGAARDQLLNLLAHLEAGLDFVEEDIEFISAAELETQIDRIAQQVNDVARQMAVRGVTADLPRVVLYGAPNVGKSSLFNALLDAEGALVSERAGTTRDYVTAKLDLGGCECELVDTAGVEEQVAEAAVSGSATGLARVDVEVDGKGKPFGSSNTGRASGTREQSSSANGESLDAATQRATATQQARGDLVILCIDASRPPNPWEQRELASDVPGRCLVFTKQDQAIEPHPGAVGLCTSARSGAGLAQLREQLRRRLFDAPLAANSAPRKSLVTPATAQRAAASLTAAERSLTTALEIVRRRAGEELVASELRHALDALGEVTGAIFTDDILDRVFSRFCIGK